MLFVNSKTQNCGVYSYGRRLWKIIGSSTLNFKYIEVENSAEFFGLKDKPKVILFNYIAAGRPSGPIGWLTNDILLGLKKMGHVVGTIGHLTDVRLDFDFVISQNPSSKQSKFIFSIPRPIPNIEDAILRESSDYVPSSQSITIGSFGFASQSKRFPKIIKLVGEQFSNANIRLNITNANYGDAEAKIRDQIINECLAIKRPPGVRLSITSILLEEVNLLRFLRANDLNVFAYEPSFSDDGGIASVIDYAIAASKPIAISSSAMFKHVYCDEICLEKRSLSSIIEYGIEWILESKRNWSELKIVEKFEFISRSVTNIR